MKLVPIFVVAVFVFLVWAVSQSCSDLFAEIEDPTERGLAYVAAAIVAHAFLSGTEPRSESRNEPTDN